MSGTSPATPPPLATIGYESATLPAVIAALKAAAVAMVIDVRAIAASRRPGFSKTMLAASLRAEGIDYVHLRALGTPKAGREAVRAGRVAEMRRLYAAHLEEPATRLALAQAAELAASGRAALLCYEADPGHCHRTLVAQQLAAASGCAVVDLQAQPPAGGDHRAGGVEPLPEAP